MNTPNPDPYIAWQVILTLGVLVAIITNVVTAARTSRAQKREVNFGFVPASKQEFDAHANDCRIERAALRAEIKAERDSNQVHASERSKTLFQQIDKVRIEFSTKHDELRADIARNFLDTERALGRIEGKLDDK